ncbi:conserved hypothetical protein [Planktothrix agardhii]|uniref:hypothetical protein n=1 Tax=Planktothrix agardhii TaxID=1160 RepID=UPI001B9EFC2C|nr:hypothetical protein [Planktothrix agardhii]CAD0224318.1 conserved hypothetical protein [Planktothrix agardhii]
MNELSNDILLYRAISKKRWIDPVKGVIRPVAFELRLQKGESGVSCDLTPNLCYQYINKCFGIIELSVGDVRELGLEVDNDHDSHVNIINFPDPDLEEQEYTLILDKLAEKARFYQNWLDNPRRR